MMESETPPTSVSPSKADDAEVSSQRISLNLPEAEGDHMTPPGSPRPTSEEGHGASPAPTGVRPGELKVLVGRASISEEHRVLMHTVIEQIIAAGSRLNEAVKSLLAGFEVRF